MGNRAEGLSMNEFQMAVCDDEEFYIEDICAYLKAFESEEDVKLIVTKYMSSRALLEDVQENGKRFDMFFLDIDMPEYTGMELATLLKEQDEQAVICFITSHTQHAFDAFQINAIGFLKKPASYVDVKNMLNKCIIQIRYLKDRKMAEETYVEVMLHKSKHILPMKKIRYIEKQRNKCVIHLIDEEIACYETLTHIYEKLDHTRFYFVHQGYIVNFNQILDVQQDCIHVTGGHAIPVSRKYFKEIYGLYMDKINRLRAEMEQQREWQ